MRGSFLFGLSVVLVQLGWTVSIAFAQETVAVESGLLYTIQPMAHCSCNPYNRSELGIRCSIYHQSGIGNYTVRWFSSRNTSDNSQPTELSDIRNRIKGRHLESKLYINVAKERHFTNFWCQAYAKNVNSSFVSSAVFELYPQDEYNGYPPCYDRFVSQQLTMVAINGTLLLPVGLEPPAPPTPAGTDTPSIQQDSAQTVIVGGVISSFFVAVIILLVCVCSCGWRARGKQTADPVTDNGVTTDTVQPTTTIQPQATVDIEATPTSSHPLENSAGYVDVETPSVTNSPQWSLANLPRKSVVHSSWTSLVSNTVAVEHYLPINPQGMDNTHKYSVRTKPPPIPKKTTLQNIRRSIINKEAIVPLVLLKPRPLPKRSSGASSPMPPVGGASSPMPPVGGASPPMPPVEGERYEALNWDTKNELSVYTCPSALSASSLSLHY